MFSISEYLGGFLRLQLPHIVSLLCNTLIQARRGGGGGRGSSSRRYRSGRGHPWLVILTSQFLKLHFESEELLHSYFNLVLLPSTNHLIVDGVKNSILHAWKQLDMHENDGGALTMPDKSLGHETFERMVLSQNTEWTQTKVWKWQEATVMEERVGGPTAGDVKSEQANM